MDRSPGRSLPPLLPDGAEQAEDDARRWGDDEPEGADVEHYLRERPPHHGD